MSEEKKLVPKLRFPEFRGAGEWVQKKLGDEGALFSSLTGKAGADFDAGKARFVTYMNVFSNAFVDPTALRFVDVKEGENQNAVASGDVFFTISSETPDEVGMSSVLLEDLENCYLNSFCALFRFSEDKRPNPVFTGYLLRQPLVRDYFTKKAQGSTRFNLSKDAFRSVPLCVPSPAEQQKIADCLSSLDELIAAQARKVDALKAYKRGLMQQLFPGEGETQPRLRFPEFQDAEKWEIRTIGDMFSLINGCAFKPEDWKPNGTPIIRIQNLNDPSAEFNYSQAPVSERNRVESGDLLFAWSGTLGSSFGARVWTGPPGVLNQHIFKVLMDEQRITLPFALLVLARVEEDIAEKSHGFKASFVHVKKSDLVKVELPLPALHEQQRIAACLSSLDALITAATQELDTLKTHKKGLMQQLFPSAGAVAA